MTNNRRKRTAHPGEPVKKKEFDCVELKRRAQARIHRKVKGMTLQEAVAYWNRPADAPLEHWWRSVKAQ